MKMALFTQARETCDFNASVTYPHNNELISTFIQARLFQNNASLNCLKISMFKYHKISINLAWRIHTSWKSWEMALCDILVQWVYKVASFQTLPNWFLVFKVKSQPTCHEHPSIHGDAIITLHHFGRWHIFDTSIFEQWYKHKTEHKWPCAVCWLVEPQTKVASVHCLMKEVY